MIWIVLLVIACVFIFIGIIVFINKDHQLTPIGIICFCCAVIVPASGLYIEPVYNVWQQGLTGEAELARAEQNRQILINEAKAKKESSVFWAEAEIERARGAAEANKIVADSLGGSEGYLRWLFIEKLDEIKSGQIIYLPTEAGIPILEAGKRSD